MLTSARAVRTTRPGINRLKEGQWHSDFKEALIVVLMWLVVCVIASLWASPS